ncbi:MAG: DNA gyrase subunit A [Eggerthellaceae bacterium]|nr:DNA gyrase subunit A [Eggerthellaceae bacterium]
MADDRDDIFDDIEEDDEEKEPEEPGLYDDDEEGDEEEEAEEEQVELEEGQFAKEVLPTDLGYQVRNSFIEYSMSVIVARALPDVRDGLKPVHRRILYGMKESGILPSRPHSKSARTVGDVMGKYHPHGDAAIYDAMVRLAQDFSIRVPLIDGHGNFGSIDGDPPAAMRYTEARLSRAGYDGMLADLDKETVDWVPNYDESLKEPKVLPSRFPNLLVNGSQGIAVGMATNIPPHNLGETIDATCLMLDNPDVTTEELMEVLPGPDFPTGGTIMGVEGIKEAYETGRGTITIRSNCEIVEKKNGRYEIIVKDIPYMVNRTKLLERMGDLIRDKKMPEISNVHDGADRHGIDIIIELKNNAIPQVVLNKLYKHTQMQNTFGINMLALVDDVPRTLSLKEALHYYILHQEDVVTRRTRYDLQEAENRAHIVEGLLIALDNIDEVIHTIRSSKTDDEAREKLMKNFSLTEVQANAILNMRLRRLTGLEYDALVEELAELRERIAYYKRVLEDESLLRSIIKEELQGIKQKFDKPRVTRISSAKPDAIDVEDLIAEEDMVVTMTNAGYVKRLPLATYRQQKRGGKGMQGVNLKENDFVQDLFIASTHAYMLFFTTKGKVYRKKVYEIPEAGRHARGTAIVNLLQLDKAAGENVVAAIAAKDFPEDEYLMFATSSGMVKKTSMKLYDRTRSDGMIAIKLKDDDELISVKHVADGQHVVMVSSEGKAIAWPESEARAMGRDTSGVRGMEVPEGQRVLNLEIVEELSDLFVITENGYGKRTIISEYPIHHRGGKGVYTIKMTEKKGRLAACKVVREDEQLIIISKEGVVVRTPVKGVSRLGRATQGVKVMNIGSKDAVTACGIAADSSNKKRKKVGAAEDDPEIDVDE